MPTKKNKKTEQEQINKKAETIQEIYMQGDEIKLPNKPLNWLAVLVLAILAGLLSGFFASWWQFKYQPRWMQQVVDNSNQISNILDLASSQDRQIAKTFDQLTLEKIASQTVTIYQQKEFDKQSAFNNIYSDKDLLGQGLIVTSDGWIVTTNKVISDVNAQYLVVTSDRKGYEIEKFVPDKFNDLIFIKIEERNLRPISLTTAANINFNQDLLVIKNTLQLHQPNILYTRLIDKSYTPIVTSLDYLHNSDKNDFYLLLDNKLATTYHGSMLANSDGDVIGIIYQNDLALPGFYLQKSISNFLSDQTKVSYNTLGVNYIDLSEVIGLSSELHQGYNKGALILGSKANNISAISEDSPAAKAKLLAGDIILAVNDQELNASTNLTKLIQEYPLGTTITLQILSGDGQIRDEIVILAVKP